MQIVRRSHTRGVVNASHHSGFLTEEQVKDHCEGSGNEVQNFVLQAGEVALIHNWVIHRSGTNVTNAPRRALSVSFMDARSRLDSQSFDRYVPSGAVVRHRRRRCSPCGSSLRLSLRLSQIFGQGAEDDWLS